MLEDFELNKYMNTPPPSDSSIETMHEIKELSKIPINKKFVRDNDPLDIVFAKIVGNDELIPMLVNASQEPILKIKHHHNRPRPKEIAHKFGINLDYEYMPSMNTPSYPSGHSAQAALIANALSDKYPKLKKTLQETARLISYSRNVAHEHYKSDSTFGLKIGNDMYAYLKNKKLI
jgi:hypothetical protein